jgi:hypothetical protein
MKDDDLLEAMVATSPAAADLVAQLRARHRAGRKKKPERNYRQLELWWKCFYRQHRDIPPDQAVAKFYRKFGRQIETALKIKRSGGGRNSLLNAVARGAAESSRVKLRRQKSWLILRGLAGPFVVTDPVAGAYLQAAQEYALLGTGPLKDLGGSLF